MMIHEISHQVKMAILGNIAKAMCSIYGHRRGKRIGQAIKPDGSPHYAEYILIQCPRCRATWNRKIKLA